MKKLFTIIATGVLISASAPITANAESSEHTVKIVNHDNKVIDTLTFQHGEKLDLSNIDTSKFSYYHDKYTQSMFSGWGNLPESGIVTEDLEIRMLERTMKISCNALPKKTEYFSKSGDIKLKGLDVIITNRTETPIKDKDGNFIAVTEHINIESGCTTSPENLDAAFAESDKATIYIYPINSDIPIASYDIEYFGGLGDTNGDGFANANDASSVLSYYSIVSVGGDSPFTPEQMLAADINRDGFVDANDASLILSYYSLVSTSNEETDWEKFLNR